MKIVAPCPACGADLAISADLRLVNWIPADRAPQGEPVLDLILDCEACGVEFNAFVVLGAFVRTNADGAPGEEN